MFDYSAGFGFNPIQMGPAFSTAWTEDAAESLREVCRGIESDTGFHTMHYTLLNDYLVEAGFPCYEDLPRSLQKVVDEELNIY